LGDKSGFDRLPGADVEKPLARAVLGALVTQHARGRDLRERLEPVAQLDGEIRHRGEIVDAALVDPAHDLPRAIGLLAERHEELGETLRRQAQQVGPAAACGIDAQRIRGQMLASAKKKRISAAAVSGPSERCTTFVSYDAVTTMR